jgi:hypothetical protein
MIHPVYANVISVRVIYGKRWEDKYGERDLVLHMLPSRMIT